jgi:cell wall-associated NlpC family hydrolase
MKTKLLKKYGKHIALALFLSLNICINFTPDGISIGMKQALAQSSESYWQSGVDWLDDFLYDINYTPGTYVYDGNGGWSNCNDCAYQVNIEEVIVYGTNLSNTPVNTSTSNIWHSVPSSGAPAWSYWNYQGEIWQSLNTSGGTTGGGGTNILELYVSSVESLVGKPYVLGANGPDSYDCSSTVCFGIRQVYPGFNDYNAHQLFHLFTRSTTNTDRGTLVFYDYTSDGIIDHVTTLTGDGNMIHPSSGSGEILDVDSTYLDNYTSSHGGTKYYREIDWSSIN